METSKISRNTNNLENFVVEIPDDLDYDLEIISPEEWDYIIPDFEELPRTSTPIPSTTNIIIDGLNDSIDQIIIPGTEFDDLPALIPFDNEPVSDNEPGLDNDKELTLDRIDKYIITQSDMEFIREKLISLEQLITAKLDRLTKLDNYHRMTKREERRAKNRARTRTPCKYTVCAGLLLGQHKDTDVALDGITQVSEPILPHINNSCTDNPGSDNLYVNKWLAKLKPVLEIIFSLQQSNLGTVHIEFGNAMLGNILESLTQHAQSLT